MEKINLDRESGIKLIDISIEFLNSFYAGEQKNSSIDTISQSLKNVEPISRPLLHRSLEVLGFVRNFISNENDDNLKDYYLLLSKFKENNSFEQLLTNFMSPVLKKYQNLETRKFDFDTIYNHITLALENSQSKNSRSINEVLPFFFKLINDLNKKTDYEKSLIVNEVRQLKVCRDLLQEIEYKFVGSELEEKLRSFKGSLKYVKESYSQEGEDLNLARIFRNKEAGTYLDIGSYHPIQYSNTYYLFKSYNWSGINIDANPLTKEAFDKFRPNDLNINSGVASSKGELNYFSFEEGAYNTFDQGRTDYVVKNNLSDLVSTQPVNVDRIDDILRAHQCFKKIDLLNLDIEGFELQVLESLDFSVVNPCVICVEIKNCSIDSISSDPVSKLLISKGYKAFSIFYNSIIFIKNDFKIV
jgi:FkbM family methyltransferase